MKKLFQQLTLATAVSAALAAPQALALEAGDIVLRVGATTVAPDEDSDLVELNGATLDLGAGPSTLSVDDNTQLGLTVEYMLSKNLGIEVLAATPFEHTASGEGELAGLDIADVKHLPPTVSAVYHFYPTEGFRPYVGAGINYTIFFDEDLTSEGDATLSSLSLTGGDVELDDSWGLSIQAGFDYDINSQWMINASVRWIDIDTEAEISFDGGSKITADIEIDPLVYTVSVGYKF